MHEYEIGDRIQHSWVDKDKRYHYEEEVTVMGYVCYSGIWYCVSVSDEGIEVDV